MSSGPTLDMDAIIADCTGCTQAQLDAFSLFVPDERIVAAASFAGDLRTNRVAPSGYASTNPFMHAIVDGSAEVASFATYMRTATRLP